MCVAATFRSIFRRFRSFRFLSYTTAALCDDLSIGDGNRADKLIVSGNSRYLQLLRGLLDLTAIPGIIINMGRNVS